MVNVFIWLKCISDGPALINNITLLQNHNGNMISQQISSYWWEKIKCFKIIMVQVIRVVISTKVSSNYILCFFQNAQLIQIILIWFLKYFKIIVEQVSFDIDDFDYLTCFTNLLENTSYFYFAFRYANSNLKNFNFHGKIKIVKLYFGKSNKFFK